MKATDLEGIEIDFFINYNLSCGQLVAKPLGFPVTDLQVGNV